MNILVLCTGNSARSILLEAILQDLGFNAFSAGSQPTGQVHPVALLTLARHKIEATAPRSKSWDEFGGDDAPEMDLVITVCATAAGETCPIWPGTPRCAHWGVNDPAAEPCAEQDHAFEAVFQTLQNRARAFVALPEDQISPPTLSEIGQIS
ncbi:arsenate reductase ArsC [Litoreibacter roseus]|uniref:arsenate reductase ArsC n=1 Tax=Litoreibacter roseus TaxID=2601869 RepID=UPI00135BE828|nr:arsenate reductase ArsC [Litoreibacter roseus]